MHSCAGVECGGRAARHTHLFFKLRALLFRDEHVPPGLHHASLQREVAVRSAHAKKKSIAKHLQHDAVRASACERNIICKCVCALVPAQVASIPCCMGPCPPRSRTWSSGSPYTGFRGGNCAPPPAQRTGGRSIHAFAAGADSTKVNPASRGSPQMSKSVSGGSKETNIRV